MEPMLDCHTIICIVVKWPALAEKQERLRQVYLKPQKQYLENCSGCQPECLKYESKCDHNCVHLVVSM